MLVHFKDKTNALTVAEVCLNAGNDCVIRPNDYQTHAKVLGSCNQASVIFRRDIFNVADILHRGSTSISWYNVNVVHGGRHAQLPDEGMFSPAAADNKNFHFLDNKSFRGILEVTLP